MRKSYTWKNHAEDTIKKIAEMQLHTPLGIHCEPDEYLETLENYTKLLFDMNEIPDKFVLDLENLDADWNRFKCKLSIFCKNLNEEFEKKTEIIEFTKEKQ